MSLHDFLELWMQNIPLIIRVLILLIFASVSLIALSKFLSARDETPYPKYSSDGVSLEQLDEALKKILARTQGLTSAAALAAADPASAGPSPEAAALLEEIQVLKKDLESKQAEIRALRENAAAAPMDASGATTPSPAAEVSKEETDKLLAQIKELTAKLQEYEIIAEDIADLSFYKEENAKLQNELHALKSSSGKAPTGPAESASTAPAPVAAAASTPTSAPAAPAVAAPTPAPAPAPAPASAPIAPASAPAAQPTPAPATATAPAASVVEAAAPAPTPAPAATPPAPETPASSAPTASSAVTSPQQPLAAEASSSASSVEPATPSSPATEAAVAPPAQAEPVPDSLIDEVLMQEFEQALVDQKKNPPSKSGPSAAPAGGLDQEPVDLDKMLTEAQMMQSSASSSDSSEASSGGAEAIPSLEALPTDAGKIEQEAASLNSGPNDQQVMEQFENFIQGGEKKSS